MLFTVDCHGRPVGLVDLPLGLFVAGRLEPLPHYNSIRETVRHATASVIELGLFGAAWHDRPADLGAVESHQRAMASAAQLALSLADANGAAVQTHFVNLLEAPEDGGVIVVASIVDAPASIGAVRVPAPQSAPRMHEER